MATRTYLWTRATGPLLLAPYLGTWDATSIGERLHGQVNWFWRLRTFKSNGGPIPVNPVLVGETTDEADWDLAYRAWVTDPLDVPQTISGTLDWAIGSFLGNAGSTGQWKVHAYVCVGDDVQQVRGVLLDNGVVDATPAFADFDSRVRGPLTPPTLTAVNAQAGDRIVVVFGLRFANALPADGITVFDTTARLWYGTMNPAQTVQQPDAVVGDATVTTEASWLEFSGTLTFAAPVAPPANGSCATAVVIPALPYTAPRLDTTESTDTNRAVWYQWTASFTGTLVLSVLGANYPVQIRVHRGAGCGSLTFLGASASPTEWVQRAQTLRAQAVTVGETYWFELRASDGGGAAPGGGGSLQFAVTEQQTDLQDDDLYVDAQHVAVYRAGTLIRFTNALFNLTPTGNAIDYTLRALNFPGPPAHTQERLYVGLFGPDPLIEVLDLRTLAEVGFTFTPLDPDNQNLSTLVFDRSGRLVVGWYGDNYDEIGALSTPAGCRVRRLDGLNLNSEGATSAAESFTLQQEVGGTDFVELLADQDTLLYTSAGRTIFRYSLATGQLAPFVTVPVEAGPRPGLRSVRVLPPGDLSRGLLVADGINVKRYDAAAQLVQVYTPTPAVHAQDLDKIEFSRDGLRFYVSDQLSTSIFAFDLETGTQLSELVTGLPTGQLCGFSVFNGYRAGVSDTPPETPPSPPGPGEAGHGCPVDTPVDPGGSGAGCPVAFFP